MRLEPYGDAEGFVRGRAATLRDHHDHDRFHFLTLACPMHSWVIKICVRGAKRLLRPAVDRTRRFVVASAGSPMPRPPS